MNSTLTRARKALIVFLATWLVAETASAQSRIEFLIDRLSASDFRVRTNAALALGATNDDEAVEPLCGALSDTSETVRQSAAAALKRLGRSQAKECLSDRLRVERSQAVKVQINRAIEAIDGGGSAPKTVANAKYYVAISAVQNNTGRGQKEVDNAILPSIRAKLESLGGYQLAPAKESNDAARAVISKRKLKGFYLSVLVDRFDYSNGNLKVRVKVAVFNYPGKALQGELTRSATQSGVRPGDTSAEDNLMGMVAADAIERFAQTFQ